MRSRMSCEKRRRESRQLMRILFVTLGFLLVCYTIDYGRAIVHVPPLLFLSTKLNENIGEKTKFTAKVYFVEIGFKSIKSMDWM